MDDMKKTGSECVEVNNGIVFESCSVERDTLRGGKWQFIGINEKGQSTRERCDDGY